MAIQYPIQLLKILNDFFLSEIISLIHENQKLSVFYNNLSYS